MATYKLKNPTSLKNQRIIDSCRPVTQINHNEYLEDCYRFSIGGSGFIIKYANDYLFLTARHVLYGNHDTHRLYEDRNQFEHFVIKNLNNMKDLGNYEERIPIISTYVPAVHLELSNSIKNGHSLLLQSMLSKEAQDIAICLMDKSYKGAAIEWNHQTFSNNDDLGRPSIGDELIVIGFPKKTNKVIANEKDNNSNMEINSCHIKGYCTNILDGGVEAIMTVTEHCNGMTYLDGISGSPVFIISQKSLEYNLVGMVIQADSKTGKTIRFITVSHLSMHLMTTDLYFPFSTLGNIYVSKQIESLIDIIGTNNVYVEDDLLEITTSNNDKFTFAKTHLLYYSIIHLLHETSLFTSKNIYLLGNVYSRIRKWEAFHALLLQNKSTLTDKHLQTINDAFLDLESYEDAALTINTLQKRLAF